MNLHLILGDQLSRQISALVDAKPGRDHVCLFEIRDEACRVRHHKKKIAFLFSAMRHFAAELRLDGFTLHYTKLDDPSNTHSFVGELTRLIRQHQPEKLIFTAPSEYALEVDAQGWSETLNIPVEIREDSRFLCSRNEFRNWAEGRKQLRMEFFYRHMRERYSILMDGPKQPIGGQWNYDAENRKRAPVDLHIPKTYHTEPDATTSSVLELVEQAYPDHFGALENFHYAVTRADAVQALELFIRERLSSFGDYQDAMLHDESWLFHSHISHYINCGLLDPLECIEQAETAYHSGHAPLNAVEGFIRQILGWREFVRGIYWLKMPDYERANFLNSTRGLPALYWGAPTKMNCLARCVENTRLNAYAHHIQRLMVLGNFALIAGISPAEVNEWFWIVYADAYQWVELPNVSGMVLFADGGLLASKPYASSGAYINRMSDYCKHCSYKVSNKNGPNACPFNYLYWDFLQRNREQLQGNPRLGMPYRTLNRMAPEKQQQIREDATRFFHALDNGETV
ncbi:cryptochrome/photolyase family protein [Coraliomargarita akajimensis]|uniref:Deoxyribodipyrimidine photolyase-related protein n=1 Tax=Coraliomargarita akajimensis (strain DSM 45221 / IAM 15411 / JCM 23193 / KCTC 12865 / 04OKA010-24) TaxID=583355 RepID=D5EKM8_CORAD|nr:cryptochrome/photolyase family protein [Coraliomargarita akajimensis]ADE54935.1 deoxyribodipyrimidine photolyase-related protein [Coraliomargarita akajimensis DSM 45221]